MDFFVGSLTPEWESSTRTVAASGEDIDADPDAAVPSAFRVLFSRGDDCVQLFTYGMAKGHIGERTFALSAESGQGPARSTDLPQGTGPAADERCRVPKLSAED